MTSPYAMNSYQGYPSQQAYLSPNPIYPQQNSSGISTFGAMTAGGIVGGGVGYLKNRHPISSDGVVSDSFAKDVFNKNLKKNSSKSTQKYFKQLNNVLKKINKVDSPEEFKKLINANKDLMENQYKGISTETFLNSVNSNNLNTSKASLKESLGAIMDFELVKTKNAVRLGWNSESKKFVKTPEFKDKKLFDIIKSTKSSNQWKKALKYGGITAGIMGALTVGYKMLVASRYN